MIHATRSTRSTRSDGDDGPGTENWANNPNNRGKEDDGSLAFWGGAWDDLIFETGERVTFTDIESESPTQRFCTTKIRSARRLRSCVPF